MVDCSKHVIIDPNFFGGGMYTLHKPPEKLSYKMEYAEIYPTSGKKIKNRLILS